MELNEGQTIRPDDVRVLRSVAATPEDPDDLHFQLLRELLHIEQGYRTASRRVGIYEALEKALEGGAFDSEKEALEFALERKRLYENAQGQETTADEPDLGEYLVEELESERSTT
jgi:DNA sulfur modification protein DndC